MIVYCAIVCKDSTDRHDCEVSPPTPMTWHHNDDRHPPPFDRHDWVVERPDGTEVRYIIDYYHDDAAAKENTVPRLHDVDSVKSISIDVRYVQGFVVRFSSRHRLCVFGKSMLNQRTRTFARALTRMPAQARAGLGGGGAGPGGADARGAVSGEERLPPAALFLAGLAEGR